MMKSRVLQARLGRLASFQPPARYAQLLQQDRHHSSFNLKLDTSFEASTSYRSVHHAVTFRKNALNPQTAPSEACASCSRQTSLLKSPSSRRTLMTAAFTTGSPATTHPRKLSVCSSQGTVRFYNASVRSQQQQRSEESGSLRNSTSSANSKQSDADRALSSSSPSEDQASRAPSDVSLSEVRRLFTLSRPEKRTLGIALGLLTISSAVSLSVPFTLGRIIDLFTSPSTANLPVSVPTAAAILAGIFAIGAAANTGRSILMRIAGQRIVKGLRVTAFTRTLQLDMAKYDLMGQAVDENGTPKQIAAPRSRPEDAEEDTAVAEKSSAKEVSKKDSPAEAPARTSRFTSALSLGTSDTATDTGVRGVGDVISRLGSDSSIVGESLTRELSEGLRALATVVVGVGMMVYISAKLTTLMLCIVPPTAIGAVVYGRYLKKLSKRTQKKIGEMIAFAEERLSSVRTVQAFNGVSPMETKAYSKKADEILELAKKEAYASGLFYGGAGFSGNITMLALLSYGGKLVAQGEITVGDLSSLMLYTAYVGGSLVSLTTFFSTIMKGLGAAARVFELLDGRPANVRLSEGIKLDASVPTRPIVFSDVHFSYPSRPGVEILKGLDLHIEKGKSIAVAGGSGSGKSTLVNLLVRFYDPTSGEVRYGNDDIKTYTPESWRERVSMVPQDPALFSASIADNIAYGKPDATMSEIREAAKLANCDFIEDLPLGFDTLVGPKAAQLSGGQRQRIAIARALLRQPSILVLDEATSALDAASETMVNEAVRNITASKSLTTILIAHRLSTLKTADEIVFMQDGRVAERGTYEELAQEGTEFWNLVRSQMLGTTSARADNDNREETMARSA